MEGYEEVLSRGNEDGGIPFPAEKDNNVEGTISHVSHAELEVTAVPVHYWPRFSGFHLHPAAILGLRRTSDCKCSRSLASSSKNRERER